MDQLALGLLRPYVSALQKTQPSANFNVQHRLLVLLGSIVPPFTFSQRQKPNIQPEQPPEVQRCFWSAPGLSIATRAMDQGIPRHNLRSNSLAFAPLQKVGGVVFLAGKPSDLEGPPN